MPSAFSSPVALLWAPGGPLPNPRLPGLEVLLAVKDHPLQEPFHIYRLSHPPNNCEVNPQILVVFQEFKAQEPPQGSNLALQD